MTKQEHYKQLLLAWSAKVNLIGPEVKRNLDAHIDEAIAAARLLEPQGEVLDFGSGGGLPAIPMAIEFPAARYHLVEADQKKWSFLKYVARECALNAVVYGERLEKVVANLGPDFRLDLVTSRAVGHPEKWVPLLAPFLSTRGRVALFESSPAAPAIEDFELGSVHELPRGASNYLVILKRSDAR